MDTLADTATTASAQDDDLARFMASFDRDGAYRVERVLKESPFETTELVTFSGANGSSLGPFVRKRIDAAAGLGSAYESLFAAQASGSRFVHLPRIIDCRHEGDELTVVMEYVRGRTLEELVGERGASERLARAVMPGICDAVAELHGSFAPPIIHRDLKPSNIILAGASETPVIIDFGIARAYRSGAQADTVRFGTRGYAAPEQFGFGQTSVRSDVYALGALLYFCCTGKQPSGAIEQAALDADGVSAPMAAVILRAAALDPAARYADAGTLAGAILEVGGEHADRAQAQAQTDGVAPTPFPLPLRVPLIRRLFDACTRAPLLGGVWNVLLLVIAVALVPACIDVVLHPTGSNAGQPMWYNACIAILFVFPECELFLLLVASRRWWRCRLPVIGVPTTGRILKAMLAVGLFAFLVLLVLNIALGI